MYIHIGGEYVISDKFIVAIFDIDTVTNSKKDTMKFLRNAEKNDIIEYVSSDIPRAVIVTLERVYISPISPQTIKKRIKKGKNNEFNNVTKA